MTKQYTYFNNAHQLIQAFGLDSGDERVKKYSVFTLYKDTVGFHVQRKYPDNIRYIPPKTRKGEPDTVAMILVRYCPAHDSNQAKVILPIEISAFDQYLSYHRNFSYDDESCPTKESIIRSLRTPRPDKRIFNEEYYYDHDKEQLIDKEGNILTGEQILSKVFDSHLDTIHPLKGLRFRFLKRIQSLISNVFDRIDKFATSTLKWMLRSFFGRKIEAGDPLGSVRKGFTKKDLKITILDPIIIFGYEAPKNVIISYCFVIFMVSLIYQLIGLDIKYINLIFSNNILGVTNFILFLALYQYLGPKFLFWLLNRIIKLRLRFPRNLYSDMVQ